MYEKVKELRRQGKTPVIKLPPGSFVAHQKLRPGRPRKYHGDEPVASRYVGRRGKNRPYCLAKGCNRALRIHQPVACSEICETQIVNDALLRLRQCGVTKDDLITLYGDV